MADTVLTLNPNPDKKGVNIDKGKYEFIRSEILAILRNGGPLGAMALVRELDERIGDEKFGASVGWYATAVRLDMEARGEIRYDRTAKKPLIFLA